MRRIVVGVDGSTSSREALQWAIEEARARGGQVEAVHTWHVPYLAVYPYGALALEDSDAIEKGARAVLDEVVDGTDTHGLEVPVERIVACGNAAGISTVFVSLTLSPARTVKLFVAGDSVAPVAPASASATAPATSAAGHRKRVCGMLSLPLSTPPVGTTRCHQRR